MVVAGCLSGNWKYNSLALSTRSFRPCIAQASPVNRAKDFGLNPSLQCWNVCSQDKNCIPGSARLNKSHAMVSSFTTGLDNIFWTIPFISPSITSRTGLMVLPPQGLQNCPVLPHRKCLWAWHGVFFQSWIARHARGNHICSRWRLWEDWKLSW